MDNIDILFSFDIDVEKLKSEGSFTHVDSYEGDTYTFIFTESKKLCVEVKKTGKTLKSISFNVKFHSETTSDTDIVTNANIGTNSTKISLSVILSGLDGLGYIENNKLHTRINIKKTHTIKDAYPAQILTQTYTLPTSNEASEEVKFGSYIFNVKTQKSIDQLTLSFTSLSTKTNNFTIDAHVVVSDDTDEVTTEKKLDFSKDGTRYVHVRDSYHLSSINEITLTLSNFALKDTSTPFKQSVITVPDPIVTSSKHDKQVPAITYGNMTDISTSPSYNQYPSYNYNYNNYNFNYNTQTVQKAYSSKEETGFVGLQNQGATCYMNSMLQSLFHLPAFRRLTYQMPTDNIEDEKKSIPLNLQRLFCRMQTGSTTCTTTALTQSFGWGSTETFMQHDIQEFCRVLIDNLETKLKGTPLEPRIADLFKGQYRNYIRCTNVKFESTRTEDFYDLQMQVKGCGNLEGSFRKYIEAEELTGDNQYSTDSFGKQDAQMGVEFVRFPTVLQIHLARFEYDFNVDRMVKNNERLEFPEEIDLSPYLASDADRSQSQVYELFGVLVHSGSASFGHYYAFLRPSDDPQWFKFNDSRVSKATKEEAVDDNFGGSSSTSYGFSYGYSAYERSDNGYMLVYVRKDAVKTVFEPVKDSEIPEDVRDYCKNHSEERSTSSYYSVEVTVITEDCITKNTQDGQKTLAKPKREAIKMDKTETTHKMLYDKIAEEFKIPVESFRLWQSTYSYALSSAVPNDDAAAFTSYYYTYILERIDGEQLVPPETQYHNLVKFFFPHNARTIEFLGIIHTDKSDKLEGLFREARKIVGLPDDAPLVAYKEDPYNSALELETDMKDSGNIYIIQQDPKFPLKPISYIPKDITESESESEDKAKEKIKDEDLKVFKVKELEESELDTITIADYIKYTLKTTKIRLFNIEEPTKPLAILDVPDSEGYDTLYKMISQISGIEYEPEKMSIVLYKGSYTNEETPSDNSINTTYETNVGSTFYGNKKTVPSMWFAINSDIPQAALKDYEMIRVVYCADAEHETKSGRVCVKRTSSAGEAMEAFKEFFEVGDDQQLELYRLGQSEMTLMGPKEYMSTYYSYRLQPHIEGSESMWLVSVAEPDYQQLKCVGVHFFAPIVEGEEGQQTIERLCGLAGVPVKNVRLMYKPRGEHWPKEFATGEVPSAVVKPGWSMYIVGKKAGKKVRSHNREMAVKIYN